VGNESEWVESASTTIDAVTKYYHHGSSRVAMRQGGEVYYLHGDHLGSTSLTTDNQGSVVHEARYLPFGEERWVDGEGVTDFTFTGQRVEAGFGLMDYNARYYSSRLGRFTSADTLVPDPANPQAWNRYAYVHNNSLSYTDPTGHDPLGEEWENEFNDNWRRMPTDHDRRDRLFSTLFLGHGEGGSWTGNDWQFYFENKDALWKGQRPWHGPYEQYDGEGLDRFVTHLNRLAGYYEPGEEAAFVQAVGFIWGSVPLGNPIAASVKMAVDPNAMWDEFPFLREKGGNSGWASHMIERPTGHASHHYAGLFHTGYFFDPTKGYAANWARDSLIAPEPNVPDLNLGYVASSHGAMLRFGIIDMSEVGSAARYALDARAGLWSSNSPGSRVPWWFFQPEIRR
jgi:RHS repeat-associated protein